MTIVLQVDANANIVWTVSHCVGRTSPPKITQTRALTTLWLRGAAAHIFKPYTVCGGWVNANDWKDQPSVSAECFQESRWAVTDVESVKDRTYTVAHSWHNSSSSSKKKKKKSALTFVNVFNLILHNQKPNTVLYIYWYK